MAVFGAMPRYFFDTIDDGRIVRDDEGLDCPDLDCAKIEAAKGLADLARDILPENGLRREMSVHVRDESGRQFFSTSIVFETKDGR